MEEIIKSIDQRVMVFIKYFNGISDNLKIMLDCAVWRTIVEEISIEDRPK